MSDVDPITQLRALVERANAASARDTDLQPVSVGTLRAVCVHMAELQDRLDYVRHFAPTFQRFGAVQPMPTRDRDAERRAFVEKAAIAYAPTSDSFDGAWKRAEGLWHACPEGHR